MSFTKSTLAAALFAAANANLRIGLISDSHFNTDYNPYSSSSLCTGSGVIPSDPIALLGRYGCDSSETLIDLMYSRFKEVFGDVDVILVPGDSVAHKVAAAQGTVDTDGLHYDAVKANL